MDSLEDKCMVYNLMQIREIEEHMYYINEKRAKKGLLPIGMEEAGLLWATTEHRKLFAKDYEVHASKIEAHCRDICHYRCNSVYVFKDEQIVDLLDVEKQGLEEGSDYWRVCSLRMEEIHELLEDGPGQLYEHKIDDDKFEI